MAQEEAEREGSERTVVREVHVDARPETLFAFFTDPGKMTRWKGRKATLDPRVGGVYHVEINDQAVARGEFVEIDPPRRVVFTWGWEGHPVVPPGSSTVEVELAPEGDGTLLRLTHRGLPEEEVDQHAHGWDHFLPRLVTAAPGGDPGPDPMSQSMESGA
jgi:uncharacterized protein YndB with AHSA1/START domain